jgi:hypothetical protein
LLERKRDNKGQTGRNKAKKMLPSGAREPLRMTESGWGGVFISIVYYIDTICQALNKSCGCYRLERKKISSDLLFFRNF